MYGWSDTENRSSPSRSACSTSRSRVGASSTALGAPNPNRMRCMATTSGGRFVPRTILVRSTNCNSSVGVLEHRRHLVLPYDAAQQAGERGAVGGAEPHRQRVDLPARLVVEHPRLP